MFFGRTDALNRLFALLANGQSVSITGDRRIGKSSLLYAVGQPQMQARTGRYDFSSHLFVHVDLQGCRLREPAALFGHWLKPLLRQENGRFQLSLPAVITPDAFEDAIYQLNRQQLRPVFLLDEFDCITLNERLDPAFFSFLRYLATNYDLSLVTASHQRLGTLCHADIVDSPFFNIFALIHLDALAETAARDLITIPSQHAGYPLAPRTGWILDLAGTQPLFLQIACFYLLEAERQGEPVDLPRVEAQFTQEAADHFAYAWKHAPDAVRRQWQAEAEQPAAPYAHYLTAGRAFRQFVREQTAVSPPFTIHAADVEAALENLWRPAQLAQNPLARAPFVARRLAQQNRPATAPNQSQALRDALHQAIESLRHGRLPDPNNSQWRSWYILHHKYEKEQPNRQIYLRLNLSERTFYRERNAAIEAVTAVLRQEFRS
jgi:hypothetical protein